jgi:hypothetical protein
MQIGFVGPDREAGQDKLGWIAQAARNLGHDPVRVRSMSGLKHADAELPLLIFEQFGAGLNAADLCDLATRRRSTWVQWWFDLVARDPDLPLGEQAYLRSWGRVMRSMDNCFVKERGLLREYGGLGIRAEYLDQGCPEGMPAVEPIDPPQWDCLVVGAMDRPQRMRDALALVRAGLSVAWIGKASVRLPAGIDPLPWVPAFLLPYYASMAKLCLSVDLRSDVEGYVSDRLYLLTGAGACVLHRGYQAPAGLPVIRYTTESELVRLARDYRASASQRAAMGIQARKAVSTHHTYEHRVAALLAAVARRKGAVAQ